MSEDNPKYENPEYNVEFQDKAQGVQFGNHNIIYNYFGYREEVVSAAPVDATDDNLPCPYRGLYHFSPNDAEYFFGRDVFIETLFEATQTRNFIPILGASGSGKSSVILAGLIPKLEQEQKGHWKFTHFRPGSDPFHALALALVPLYTPDLDETEQIAQTRKLAGYLNDKTIPLSDVFAKIQQNHFNHRILLIADQFEEIYTQCSDHTVRRRFLDCLLTSFQSSNSGASSSTVLVTTMRADFLANALSYRPFADMLQNADIKLGAMSREELTEVIEKPAKSLGVSFEAGLVERILNDVEDEPGNLPLLEFTLTELWDKRTGKQLTHDAYEAIGQVKGALADYADNKYKNLTAEEQEQARRIFIQLVRPGEGTEDTRRRANRAELGEENWNLITCKDGLADSRLVVTGRNNATGQETVEVVHEALIQNWGELRQWMETDRKFRAWQEGLRVAKQQWEITERDKGSLLRGAALVDAEEKLLERPKDLIYEQEFIRTSINERDRLIREEEEKRQRELEQEKKARKLAQKINIIAFIFLAMVTLLSGRLVWQWQKTVLSEIKALIASSEASFSSNQQLDALIASIRAGRLLKSSLGVDLNTRIRLLEALQKAMYQLRERNRLEGHTAPVESVSFSPDGKMLASASDDGTVKLWSSEGKLLETLEGHKTEVRSVSFSPDGKFLASAGDAIVKLWHVDDEKLGKLYKTIPRDRDSTVIYSVNFSPDEDDPILAVAHEKQIKLYRKEELINDTLETHPAVIWSVSFSPDGERLASGDDSGFIKLWKLQDEEKWNSLRQISAHEASIYKIRFNQNGKILASSSQDGTVKLGKFKGQFLNTFQGHQAGLKRVRFSRDGKTLISVSGGTKSIIIWNLEDFALDTLLDRGCNLLGDYFQNNLYVSQEDRRFCSEY